MAQSEKILDEKLRCYHCGEDCTSDDIKINDKVFCCNGCKTVFELLDENNLCTYYDISENPGIQLKTEIKRNYDFLNDEELKTKLIDFTDGKVTTLTLSIPQMHCSSCIWILENLQNLDSGILSSKVDFLKKKLMIKFSEEFTSLPKIVASLDSIGYEPQLNLAERSKEKIEGENKKLYYKIGIAGFCFGNIMLLSFPEYLALGDTANMNIRYLFGYLNLILALPVFFYSSSEYYISALKGLRKKIFNIDVPITIGIAVLFFRSSFEILTQSGAGYFDSLAGLVFFLLVGKLFQNKTYEALNFERNYKSYFPIAVSVRKNNKETTVPVEKLSIGSRLIIRNNEIIPADSILIRGSANIDYSFVTGESRTSERQNGDMIYAGGRQVGAVIEVETVKDVSQSYLTQLWNNKAFHESEEGYFENLANKVSKHFTFAILAVAAAAFIFWSFSDINTAFNAFTAVLIVACPCALALSTPFTLGNTLRIFGKNKFYLKSAVIVEKLANINSIVFDKTGTITESGKVNVNYSGEKLSEYEKLMAASLVRNSAHPLSKNIFSFLKKEELLAVKDFKETSGVGIEGIIDGIKLKIGSRKFIESHENSLTNDSTASYLSIDNVSRGKFEFSNNYRAGLSELIKGIRERFSLHILSGDNDKEREALSKIFPDNCEMKFKQSPHDKLNFISLLQSKGKNVLMLGDGLNDAGALRKSNVGITISEDINNFSPACDGILEASAFSKLIRFINFSKTSRKVIIASFIISFIYNLVGISFAVSGNLVPVIAAILMPLSSISVVVFTSMTISLLANKRGLLKWK